jgi:hypothetical protein
VVSWRESRGGLSRDMSRGVVSGRVSQGGCLRIGVLGRVSQGQGVAGLGGVSPGRAGLPSAKKGSRRKDGDGERRPGPALTQAKKGSRKRNPDCF